MDEHENSHSEESRLSRRDLLIGTGSLVAGLTLAQAGAAFGAGRSSRETKTIGWSQSNRGVALWNNVAIPAFEKEIKAKGYKSVVLDAKDNLGQQGANFENLLTLGVSSIVMLPVSGPEAVSFVSRANTQGVKIIAFNAAIMDPGVAGFVARDNVKVAESIARAALKDTGLRGNWVITNGDPANVVAQQIEKGYHNVIDPYIKNGTMKLVSDQYSKAWDPNVSRAQVENALTKTNDKITGILNAADETAVGPLAALKERKLQGKVWMGSQNGIAEICRAILLGEYTLSVFSQYDIGAKVAADLAIKLANGQNITSPLKFDVGHGKTVPFFKVPVMEIRRSTLVPYLKAYSPGYVDAKQVFEGVPKSKWPAGAAELLARKG